MVVKKPRHREAGGAQSGLSAEVEAQGRKIKQLDRREREAMNYDRLISNAKRPPV